MTWPINPRPAKSLTRLQEQVDRAAPHRDKSSDGMIAGAAHHAANPNSDHEAHVHDATTDTDVVTAFDITNDPAHGVVSRDIAEAIIKSRDQRVKYIISNRQICSSKVSPWQWRPYDGENPHTEHVHISVFAFKALYDDVRDWALPARLGPSPLPDAPVVTVPTPALVFSANGKGSWYSQFRGKYEWKDDGDKPNSNALGVPDSAQGISFYNRATLGHWFEVRAPNGNISIEQQTDIGPHPRTGRKIDISAAAAERFGYSPNNFPTDGVFYWSSVPIPVDASLTPQQQATRFRDARKISPRPVVVAKPPPDIAPVPIQSVQPASAGFLMRLLRRLFG